MEDGICSAHKVLVNGGTNPSIQISIEAREIAAADFQPNAVTFAEDIAGGPQVDRELNNLSRIQERRLLLRIAGTSAKYAFGEILREPIRGDIHQFAGEVGIHG